jgi:hypothetical protein
MSGEFPMDCPLHDSLLRVHYKGMLLDESKSIFYDTRVDNDGEPLEFCSGEGLVSNTTLIFLTPYNDQWNKILLLFLQNKAFCRFLKDLKCVFD